MLRRTRRARRSSPSVVTIRRPPSISLARAKELDLAAEDVLKRFPEVMTTLAMTGRAEVAIDPVGNDNTDIFVHLRPKKEWKTAKDFDEEEPTEGELAEI